MDWYFSDNKVLPWTYLLLSFIEDYRIFVCTETDASFHVATPDQIWSIYLILVPTYTTLDSKPSKLIHYSNFLEIFIF